MYARYRTRSKFFKRPEKALKAYGVTPNLLRRPRVKQGLLNGIYKDETIDLRDRERLDMIEAIRHPKERDFYQDHTYHNQWESRDLEKHQKIQLTSHYSYFSPRFSGGSSAAAADPYGGSRQSSSGDSDPWLFYPGDQVEVITGEGKGQRGAIIAVVRYKNDVLVQNVNVQDVVIPATETRPEQTVQREHPISADRIRHIDPSTGELCTLDLVTVKHKSTGELEQKRISLESGVLLPLPEREEGTVEAGDPLKDTPITDADEATYDPAKEGPLLMEKKLQEMENYFISNNLRRSYEFHSELIKKNGQQLAAFQVSVVERATETLARRIAGRVGATPEAAVLSETTTTTTSASGQATPAKAATAAAMAAAMPSWWSGMVASYAENLREEDAIRADEAAEAARLEAADRNASNRQVGDVDMDSYEAQAEEFDDEEEERA